MDEATHVVAISPMQRPMQMIEMTKVKYPLKIAGRQGVTLEAGGVTSASVLRLLGENEGKGKNRITSISFLEQLQIPLLNKKHTLNGSRGCKG